MKRIFILAALAIATALSACHQVSAAEPYVELFAGFPIPSNTTLGGEGDPADRLTLERRGRFMFGGGAGVEYKVGKNHRIGIGGEVNYTAAGCDRLEGPGCDLFLGGERFRTVEIALDAVGSYWYDTPAPVDPYVDIRFGFGYIAAKCRGRDGCPNGELRSANYADAGFNYGACAGPLTSFFNGHLKLIAKVCFHRTESAWIAAVPHGDALKGIDGRAVARVSW